MENNLIYDYCIQNKVAIQFKDEDQLQMLNAMFNRNKESYYAWPSGGYVSYTQHKRANSTSVQTIGPNPFPDHILLKAEEFFTLALPNKSILESIK